jgi:hypothetical protein
LEVVVYSLLPGTLHIWPYICIGSSCLLLAAWKSSYLVHCIGSIVVYYLLLEVYIIGPSSLLLTCVDLSQLEVLISCPFSLET